jgi:hypothetical protein
MSVMIVSHVMALDMEPWRQTFSRPVLYFPSRRLLPAPLREFVDFA